MLITIQQVLLERTNTNLSRATLTGANLQFSLLIGCREYRINLICDDANFSEAIIDDELSKYLRDNRAKYVPHYAPKNKKELQTKLEDLKKKLKDYCHFLPCINTQSITG